MKIKVMIVMISFVTASIFLSGGYGFWQKELMIKGDITVIPDAKIMAIPPLKNIVPSAKGVEGNANSVDTQKNEQPSDAAVINDENAQKPDQPSEQGENNDKKDPMEQVKEIEQPKQIEPSKPIVSAEPENGVEQLPKEQAPLNLDNKSSNDVDSSKVTESKEEISLPQNNAGDKK